MNSSKDSSSSFDITDSEEIKNIEVKDAGEVTTWCTFEDFCKYSPEGRGRNLTEDLRKLNWKKYVREKALATIFEVERFQARNKT